MLSSVPMPANAYAPMLCKLSGKTISVSAVFSNALASMVCRYLLHVTVFSDVQPLNADPETALRYSGIWNAVKETSYRNAAALRLVTLSGICTLSSAVQFWNAFVPMLDSESSNDSDCTAVQPSNADSPTDFTPVNALGETNDVQPLKNRSGIAVSVPSPKFTVFKPVAFSNMPA